MALRIGFRTSPQNVDWRTLESAWAEAGRHDVFDSGWLNDHFSDPGQERGGRSFEALTTLAALAHLVPGKRVGHTVLAATFRHPSVLAKQAVTLDHLTGGRFTLGLGAGWHVGEHESFGIELPAIGERMGRFEAQVRVLKALFGDAAREQPGVTLEAPPYRLEGAVMEPGPLQPGGPPLWLGAQKPRGMRLTARLADGWNYAANLSGSVDGFRERHEALRRICADVGRDIGHITVSVQLIVPDDAGERRRAREAAEGYARAGAQEIMLTIPARSGADGVRRLASEVALPLRDALG
ncbi:MAG: LLM class flavin-dependent oxidoreductase [Chloroflexi bacterium]|nr:LLM class flavin-dependent oxidoreductase [Chloroflexota bacterium]MDQ3408026.1 LLM class flavin-dependent oxidoreductase [Chloroflexota bacterium]